jgi:glutaredoxin
MELTIYSKSGCTYCDKLKQFLDSRGISYQNLQLNEDYTTSEFINKFGKSTFPRVLLGDELIGGMRETVTYLVENGYVTK